MTASDLTALLPKRGSRELMLWASIFSVRGYSSWYILEQALMVWDCFLLCSGGGFIFET
jgi:hypothetical protein